MYMTKEEMNFVTEFVQKTLGTPAAEAASTLFDIKGDGTGELKGTALPYLLDKDKARVQVFKDEVTQAHDKGFRKAQADALTKFETDLKAKHGITSDKQGAELIDFIVAEKIKADPNGEKDAEKVKRSSIYLDMVERLTKEKNDAVKAESDKYTQLETKIQKESTLKTVSETALDYIKTELMPILPEGKTAEGKSKADIQLQKFIKDLTSEYDIEVKDGRILLSKDGKLLEDAHGRNPDFKEIVKAKASETWDFKEGEARKGTGNSNNGGAGGNGGTGNGDGKKTGYSGPVPKDEKEFMSMIGAATTNEEKIGISEAWAAANKM